MTDEIEAVAAVLVRLLEQGHRADTLECLTHGDGRGTVPPNTLAKAIAPLLATIAALRADLAQAEERGVRMGIEAAAGAIRNDVFAEAQDTEWDTGFNYAKKLAVSMVLHLYPAAIIRANVLSELAAADAVLLGLPDTLADSDGDDGA